MAFLTAPPKYRDRADPTGDIHKLCVELIEKTLLQEINKKVAIDVTDAATKIIERALDNDPKLRGRLANWLAGKGIGISPTMLIHGNEYAGLRTQAIKELGVECHNIVDRF